MIKARDCIFKVETPTFVVASAFAWFATGNSFQIIITFIPLFSSRYMTNMSPILLFPKSNTIISIKFLSEQFLCKYDFPALAMMSIGALIIVLIAKPNEKMYTKDEMVTLLTSYQSMAFFIFTVVACSGSAIYLYFFLR